MSRLRPRENSRGATEVRRGRSRSSAKKAATKKASSKASISKRLGAAKKSPVIHRARIAHMKTHEHSLKQRQEYVPGLLVVKCKENVIANVPDLQSAHVASIRGFSLPKAVASPFDYLEQNNLIREVIPIFSRLTRGRSLSIAPTSVAASFATSVRDSESEDLRGINMLRLARSADLKSIEAFELAFFVAAFLALLRDLPLLTSVAPLEFSRGLSLLIRESPFDLKFNLSDEKTGPGRSEIPPAC